MLENDAMPLLKKISDDLDTLKRLLRIQTRRAVSSILDEIATTIERQQMWRPADGTMSNEQISETVGVALRSVQYFMQEAENLGLVFMLKRGYPKRVEDIIPSQWKSARKTRSRTEINIDEKGPEPVNEPFSGGSSI